MKQFLRNNGLSIVWFGLFLVFQLGMSLVGMQQHNQQLEEHHQPPLDYLTYLTSGSFLEATMENWESEFLQMFAYVLLTAFLFQKGSAESKKLDEDEPVDRDPRLARNRPDAPWPVRKGGLILRLYENSLGLAFLLMFLLSFLLHAVGGVEAYNQDELLHGGQALTLMQYLGSAHFWFESLQNWQSEFFSIGLMVVLTIVLRQRGSSQSKPVDSPDSLTGSE